MILQPKPFYDLMIYSDILSSSEILSEFLVPFEGISILSARTRLLTAVWYGKPFKPTLLAEFYIAAKLERKISANLSMLSIHWNAVIFFFFFFCIRKTLLVTKNRASSSSRCVKQIPKRSRKERKGEEEEKPTQKYSIEMLRGLRFQDWNH